MDEYYCIALTIETHIRKIDLSSGFVDEDFKIRNNNLIHIKQMFPEELYSMTELHNSYVFSLNKSTPVKPLIDVIEAVYDVMDIYSGHRELQTVWTSLKKELAGVGLERMIEISHQYYRLLRRYHHFEWKSFNSSIHTETIYNVETTEYGIQIYLSDSPFTAELPAEISAYIERPLKAILKDLPYSDLLSVYILHTTMN